MSGGPASLSSRQTLNVQHFRLKNFGCDVDGDPVNNDPIPDPEGPYVRSADVKRSLNRMVALNRLTPETRTRIIEQLDL